MQVIIALGDLLRRHIDVIELRRTHRLLGSVTEDNGVNIFARSPFPLEVAFHTQDIVRSCNGDHQVIRGPGHCDVRRAEVAQQLDHVTSPRLGIVVPYAVVAGANSKTVFVVAASADQYIVPGSTIKHIVAPFSVQGIVAA